MQPQESEVKRILEVRCAGWLSFTDLCLHCGFEETTMRKLTKRTDFPTPVNVTGTNKGKRWNKETVDEWMEAHLEASENVV